MSSVATRATTALDQARIPYTVHTYAHDERASSYGLEAVEALGLPARRLFKTLLITHDEALGVGMVPVDSRLDLKAVAVALGWKKATMTEPAVAQRVTGYVIGGISPIGQKRRLPMVLDSSALEQRSILVSAGVRGADVELAPTHLVHVTGARVAVIARR